MTTTFDQAFAAVVGVEGGYSTDRNDRGNWTGGAIGKGELRGTKYGISAAAYPNKDIANLTLDQARSIYLTDYFYKVRADTLPPPLALLAFDAAVNAGPGRAIQWLQAATQQRRTLAAQLAEFQAQRAHWQLSLPTASTYGLGWARRLMTVLLAAQAMEGAAQAPAAPPAVIQVHVLPVHPAAPSAPVRADPNEAAITEALNEQSLTQAMNMRPQQ